MTFKEYPKQPSDYVMYVQWYGVKIAHTYKTQTSTYQKNIYQLKTHKYKYNHFTKMSEEEHFQPIDFTFWAAEKLSERPSKPAIMLGYFGDLLIRHRQTKTSQINKQIDCSLGPLVRVVWNDINVESL